VEAKVIRIKFAFTELRTLTCSAAGPNNLPMLRTLFLFLALGISIFVSAQVDAVTTLSGGSSQQWTVIGNSSTATPKCSPGDATYTFSAKQVVVGKCTGGAWKSNTETLDTWSASGKSGISFGGARYEVKSLPPSAPACKGNTNCVRLVTVPDGKTDATRTTYLTH
jgi:hypothetical protein